MWSWVGLMVRMYCTITSRGLDVNSCRFYLKRVSSFSKAGASIRRLSNITGMSVVFKDSGHV